MLLSWISADKDGYCSPRGISWEDHYQPGKPRPTSPYAERMVSACAESRKSARRNQQLEGAILSMVWRSRQSYLFFLIRYARSTQERRLLIQQDMNRNLRKESSPVSSFLPESL